MRISLCLSAALTLAVGLAAAIPAEAQSRRQPLRVTVEGRSWLDPGRVAPPHAGNRHAYNATFTAAPAFGHVGGRYGEDTLPPRLGAGANPFANSLPAGP